MSTDSIPTILSITFGIMTLFLGVALTAVVYFVRDRLNNLRDDIAALRSELAVITGQLRTEARQDRAELKDGLRRAHERVDVVPDRFVKREDCIIAQNRLDEGLSRLDEKITEVLKHVHVDPSGG